MVNGFIAYDTKAYISFSNICENMINYCFRIGITRVGKVKDYTRHYFLKCEDNPRSQKEG